MFCSQTPPEFFLVQDVHLFGISAIGVSNACLIVQEVTNQVQIKDENSDSGLPATALDRRSTLN